MEIGELAKFIFKGKKEIIDRRGDLEDILSQDKPVLFHTTKIEKLPEILRQGLISRSFADRIGHSSYETRGSQDPWEGDRFVFIGGWLDRDFLFDMPAKLGNVAILVKPISPIFSSIRSEGVKGTSKNPPDLPHVKYRIAPREFTGIVLPSKEPDLKLNLDQVIGFQKKSKLRLPIYDSEGNLLWPERMSYEKIVRMLAEKQT